MKIFIAHWTDLVDGDSGCDIADWDFVGGYSTREGAEYAIERKKKSLPGVRYDITELEINA